MNASPDLRAQIEAFPALQPAPETPRNSPIEAVLLTNGDLDHVLGLFLLREGTSLRVHATPAVRETLSGPPPSPGLLDLLKSFCGLDWCEPPSDFVPLLLRNGARSGLSYRAILLPGDPPRFSKIGTLPKAGHSVAYEIVDEKSGALLLVAPDVAALTPELRSAITRANAILFDGTFWTGNEMHGIHSEARTATQMGHLPIHGGSLETLGAASARLKIYLHINNTNPILAASSPERTQVEGAGIIVGADGMQFEL